MRRVPCRVPTASWFAAPRRVIALSAARKPLSCKISSSARAGRLNWLFERCRLIAKALDNREIALAQILGLAIPIADLEGERLVRLARAAPFIEANFNPHELRTPMGDPDGDESACLEKGGARGPRGEGFSGGCQSGGTSGTTAMYHITGRDLCRDRAVKIMGLENESGGQESKVLEPYLIKP